MSQRFGQTLLFYIFDLSILEIIWAKDLGKHSHWSFLHFQSLHFGDNLEIYLSQRFGQTLPFYSLNLYILKIMWRFIWAKDSEKHFFSTFSISPAICSHSIWSQSRKASASDGRELDHLTPSWNCLTTEITGKRMEYFFENLKIWQRK